MAYFGVYIPPSKAGFEGSVAQCVGSIAADNIKILPEYPVRPSEEVISAYYEDPEYPPDSPLWLIFKEKSKALDVLRHYKEARLREFPNREQAESYVQFGFESIQSLKRYGKAKPSSKSVQMSASMNTIPKSTVNSTDNLYSASPTGSSSSMLCPGITLSMASMLLSLPNSSSSSSIIGSTASIASTSASNNSLNSERPPFRAPTKQELVEFRKQIEAGNYERIKRIAWDNPRFLISSGDTPTSLKEGYRYNAMHICAQVNQARIAELLLKIISDLEFTQLYAGKKSSSQMCADLNENLVDYYLNMPDKGRGETPLHFAVKNGHVAVVEVLTSYPQCKLLKNAEGLFPKDIICQRAPHASQEVLKKLNLLLSEPHYVPVLRAAGNELPPQVGQPFTPNDPPNLQPKTDELNALNVDLKISALAGPMPREQAFSFFRRWKTPPRVGSNVMSSLANSPYISPMKSPSKPYFIKSPDHKSHLRRVLFSPRATAANKSFGELNGNQRAQQGLLLQSGEVEQTEHNNNCASMVSSSVQKRFLDMPSTPLRSDLCLNYRSNVVSTPKEDASFDKSSDISLNMSVSTLNDSFRERHIKNSDIEKGLEVVGRQLARQEQLEWREYWDFLDAFVDMSSAEGLARLEDYLSAKSEHAWLLSEKSDPLYRFSHIHHYLDLIAERGRSNCYAISGGAIAHVMTPYTCVEKSLQVFAKRITKTLINNIGNVVSINDTLLSELKRLKSLIVSFKEDARFISVDFSKVHSRISHLVASYIANSQDVSTGLRSQLIQIVRKLVQYNGDRREHLHCVCACMLIMLEQARTVRLPDKLKTEELCSAAWDLEQCCNCLWDANFCRKTTRQKRASSLRAHGKELGCAPKVSNTFAITGTSNGAVVVPMGKANAWRTNGNNSDDDDDDSDDDSCYFECENDNTSDDEEKFMTPPESVSPILSCDVEPPYELFIFGKEPTKRDLDVLNAIFHVDIDKEALPLVHAWRTAMEGFSTAEMDLFPSPQSVKKMHKPSYFSIGSTPKTPTLDSMSLAHPKKLFGTPKLNTVARRHSTIPSTRQHRLLLQNPTDQESAWPEEMSPIHSIKPMTIGGIQAFTASAGTQSFQTPLNKMRGLFSKYRETLPETSPLPNSPGYVNGRLNRSMSLDKSD